MRHFRFSALLAGCLFAGAASAAPDPGWQAEHHLALGVRLGFVPPVLAVAEVLARPVSHLAPIRDSGQRDRSSSTRLPGTPGRAGTAKPSSEAASLFFLADEIAPCPAGTFICIGNVLPRVLPTLDLAFRFSPF